jgi:hypothetical protein
MSEVRFCVRTMSEKSPGASQILNASSIVQEVRNAPARGETYPARRP